MIWRVATKRKLYFEGLKVTEVVYRACGRRETGVKEFTFFLVSKLIDEVALDEVALPYSRQVFLPCFSMFSGKHKGHVASALLTTLHFKFS